MNTRITTVSKFLVSSCILLSIQPCWSATQAPNISVPSGALDQPRQVAIGGPTGATIYYTTDGGTPTTSSLIYSGPLLVNYTQTIKAIAVLSAVSSTVSSATYTLDSTHWPAPDPADTTALKLTVQFPTTGITQ
jgi:hypothetical protein